MLKINLEFVSIACNRVSSAADYSLNGIVAYAAGNFIAIYHPNNPTRCGGVKQTLRGHQGRVNCVKFLRRGSGANQHDEVIISGSADMTCRIWKKNEANEYKEAVLLSGHTSGINCIAVLHGITIPENQQSLVVAGALDGWIRVWQIPPLLSKADNEPLLVLEPIQSLNVAPKYPLCLAMACLPNSTTPILVTGSTDNLVRVYARQTLASKSIPEFIQLLTLHGHQDWIRAVDIATYTGPLESSSSSNLGNGINHFKIGDLILATASQDKYIRLWRITPSEHLEPEEKKVDNESKVHELDEDEDENLEVNHIIHSMELDEMKIATKAYIINIDAHTSSDGIPNKNQYSIMFDALLVGHDDWVHSVFWQLPIISTEKNTYHQPLKLISSSTDRSIFVWSPDSDTTLWNNEIRVGDISGLNLGFYGAIMSPDGKTLLSHAYNGAISIWEQDDKDSLKWMPRIGATGHSGPVTGLEWDPEGRYFITVSKDQTSRLWSSWVRCSLENSKNNISTWHEMARPQIHGYDLQCVGFVNKYCFVSGADEKVIRVFQAPKAFLESYKNWTGAIQDTSIEAAANLPLGASLPALGLSNKAVYQDDNSHSSVPESSSSKLSFDAPLPTFTAVGSESYFTHPPFEHHLSTTTLWPEINKLYGHGYEIYSLGCSRDGKIVASSCKAAKTDHASIKLWCTTTWKEISQRNPLLSHSLTVTAIKFSPNETYLLTVGRDRMWSLFIKSNDEEQPYKLLCNDPKAHSRVIWDADWSSDEVYFATGSRDKTIKIWKKSDDSSDVDQVYKSCTMIKCDEAVTSVAFMPRHHLNRYYLAAGLEDGRITVYILDKEVDSSLKIYKVVHVDIENCHCASVTTLKWANSPKPFEMYLSSCSEDHSVRLWTIGLS